MKKRILLFCLVLAMVLSNFNIVFAASTSKVVGDSGVKIFINAKYQKFKATPVIINNEVLLPITEFPAKIGITSKNVVYNKSKKTINITSGTTKLSMTLNSKNAHINKKYKALIVAPVLYKNIAYIPAKFVAEGFGNKYIWDKTSKSVYIMKLTDFNKIKALSKKSETFEETKIIKIADSTKISGNGMEFLSTSTEERDNIKKIIYKVEEDEEGKGTIESYIINNAIYTRYTKENQAKWAKEVLSAEEFKDKFDSESSDISDDIMCCCLKITKSDDENEILLTGDVSIDSLDYGETEGFNSIIQIKISINKKDYSTKYMKASGSIIISDMQFKFETKTDFTYLDSSYVIATPKDLEI